MIHDLLSVMNKMMFVCLKAINVEVPELNTFGIFKFFSIIKNDCIAFFSKLITYCCTSPI